MRIHNRIRPRTPDRRSLEAADSRNEGALEVLEFEAVQSGVLWRWSIVPESPVYRGDVSGDVQSPEAGPTAKDTVGMPRARGG